MTPLIIVRDAAKAADRTRQTRHPVTGPLVALVAVMLLAAGCGSDDSGDGVAIVEPGRAGSGTTTPAGGSDNDSGEASDSADDRANDDDPADPVDTGGPGADDADLPGEPFDIGPPAGSALDVVGVRYDDVLNFRTMPNPSAPIVDTVAPEASTAVIVSSGGGRLLTSSAWWEVTVDGQSAWANLRFLGMLGATDDILAELVAGLASTSAPTVDELIDAIADARADGPEPLVELVTPVEGLDADGAQVTIDVLGIGDDAVKGERLVLTFDLVFVDPDAAELEVEAYELVDAQRTVICGRGLTGQLCT
ncbi:MAG: hypothetical protein OEV40_27555 [Acidimicrobiia bacterium]|nr:hypothetical protein [Acidimicrobiia bacterium]